MPGKERVSRVKGVAAGFGGLILRHRRLAVAVVVAALDELPPADMVAIDIPIGLPESGRRRWTGSPISWTCSPRPTTPGRWSWNDARVRLSSSASSMRGATRRCAHRRDRFSRRCAALTPIETWS